MTLDTMILDAANWTAYKASATSPDVLRSLRETCLVATYAARSSKLDLFQATALGTMCRARRIVPRAALREPTRWLAEWRSRGANQVCLANMRSCAEENSSLEPTWLELYGGSVSGAIGSWFI